MNAKISIQMHDNGMYDDTFYITIENTDGKKAEVKISEIQYNRLKSAFIFSTIETFPYPSQIREKLS